ncbi:erythromycin biosynthesis sensory transduction protein eryC1 [archaeon]|nr:MAG: erythromycin biosynthesis sensory transduction protein eryC1 [archaeon]
MMNIGFPSHEVWSCGLQARVLLGLRSTLRTDDLVLGKGLVAFEETLATYVGTEYAAAVGSGSDAIYLALRALEVKAGDEVVAPANVCVGVMESILRAGVSIHFADIDRDRYTLDACAVKKAISPRTKAVLCVHTYGLPSNMDELNAVARESDLRVIELCGQAFGATLNGRSVGTFGDVACFSFNPSKILGGVGDGGAVVTNSEQIAGKVRHLANHGRAYVGANAEYIGVSSRLDTFNALVLTHRLKRVNEELRKRRRIARYYRALLSRFKLQAEPPGYQSSTQFFVIEIPQRDRVRQMLERQGISTKIHYALPYKMPAYHGCSLLKGMESLVVTEEVAQSIMTIPFHNRLRRREADYVAKCLSDALNMGDA